MISYLLRQFERCTTLRYHLTRNSSLILSKDERSLNKFRRYKSSPFPLLSNIEYFCSSVGEMNTELAKFGILSRSKINDKNSKVIPGTKVHILYHDSANAKGNKYLRKQYARLESYRRKHHIQFYWQTCWDLLSSSWFFKIACLNSWNPRWYKSLNLKELQKIMKGLHQIISQQINTPLVKNVWIESPKGKWRQLGIPTKCWRLYLHILNMFISYIYEPHLPSHQYEGFIFNRGCKSWWEHYLWNPILTSFSFLIELDFSSGFPNLSLHGVKSALYSDGLIPHNLINLFLTHLKAPTISSSNFPTLETFVEHYENSNWKRSCRSVHMGLGVSPILFVITLNWSLKQLNWFGRDFQYKWYADDGSFYFNWTWLINFIIQHPWHCLTSMIKQKNPVLQYLNSCDLFRKTGLRICPQKSGFVKMFNLWLKPYKSLGLTLYTPLTYFQQVQYLLSRKKVPLELKASTRGRGANPSKNQPSTLPSNTKLNFSVDSTSAKLNLKLLIEHYQPYWGLLLAKLYKSSSSLTRVNIQLKALKQSLLGQIEVKKWNKKLARFEKITLYNSGSKMNKLLLTSIKDNSLNSALSEMNPNLKRIMKLDWPKIDQNLWRKSVEDPLICPCWESDYPEKEYFKKYSEIKLSRRKLESYKEQYEHYKIKQQKEKDKIGTTT